MSAVAERNVVRMVEQPTEERSLEWRQARDRFEEARQNIAIAMGQSAWEWVHFEAERMAHEARQLSLIEYQEATERSA